MKCKDIIDQFKPILNKYVIKYDVRKTNKGRKNTFDTMFYIKHVLIYLFTDISWSRMDLFLNGITGDAIRKKFVKWVSLDIFTHLFSDYLNRYRKHNPDILKNLFMDATIIKNKCVPKSAGLTGYCSKLPNKLSTKITLICDINKIGLACTFHESHAHDSKHIEEVISCLPKIITELYTYNKPGILTADKGYLINSDRHLQIRKNKHMTINTDIRSNMKRRNKTKKNKQLLKKRIKVEHLNARLLTSFKGLSTMKYSNLDRLKALFYLAFSIQIFEYFEERV